MHTATDTRTANQARADFRADLARALADRPGWEPRNLADIPRMPTGYRHPATGAVMVGVPDWQRGEWRPRWAVAVPDSLATTRRAFDSILAAIDYAGSLPEVPAPVATHHDGNGAACWCDQPTAAR